ncbi:MAG: hypothetical protein L6Q99_19235 [Planctomycetes bacterium]|nr:hypothetical protein [Planctomycetota bacterium]
MRVAVASLACCAAACAHPRPHGVGPKPRGWLELSGGIADLRADRAEVFEDGLTLGFSGGIDVVQGPPDIGFDLGVFASEHQIQDGYLDGYNGADDVNVFRFLGGVRATSDLGSLPFSVYVRGGWYYRAEFDESRQGLDEDGWGTYLGGGIEYMLEPDMRFGPFVMFERGEEGFPEEWLFGFSARFYGAE